MGQSQYILPGATMAFCLEPKPELTKIFSILPACFQYLHKTGMDSRPLAIQFSSDYFINQITKQVQQIIEDCRRSKSFTHGDSPNKDNDKEWTNLLRDTNRNSEMWSQVKRVIHWFHLIGRPLGDLIKLNKKEIETWALLKDDDRSHAGPPLRKFHWMATSSCW